MSTNGKRRDGLSTSLILGSTVVVLSALAITSLLRSREAARELRRVEDELSILAARSPFLAARSLEAEVVTASGERASDAVATLFPIRENPVNGGVGRTIPPIQLDVDPDGKLRIQDVAPGKYAMVVRSHKTGAEAYKFIDITLLGMAWNGEVVLTAFPSFAVVAPVPSPTTNPSAEPSHGATPGPSPTSSPSTSAIGVIRWNPPSEMEIEREYRVKARIALDTWYKSLPQSAPERAWLETQKPLKVMEGYKVRVQLIGTAFEIGPPEARAIVVSLARLADEPPSWEWQVVPQKPGNHQLWLVADLVSGDDTMSIDHTSQLVFVRIGAVKSVVRFTDEHPTATNVLWVCVGAGLLWVLQRLWSLIGRPGPAGFKK